MNRKTKYIIASILMATITVSLFWTRLAIENDSVQAQGQAMESYAKQEESLQLYATSAVLMDADSGRVLYGKNENAIMPMASTTKIMTCIVALEYGNMMDSVAVSSYASSMPKVRLGIKEGEHYQLGDLLYSLMLESYNDSAVAIAEHIGGSVDGFASLMNQKARDIGCYDTYFITPNGLDASATIILKNGETVTKAHATTASDLAKIMSYCIRKSPQREKFLEITRTANCAFYNQNIAEDGTITNGSRYFTCSNHNAFLSMMEGALSGKTGYTNNAGYCYVGALENGGRTYVVALLACGWPNHKSYKWSDAKQLMNYGIENYEYHSFDEVEIDESKLRPIKVVNGQTEGIGDTAYAGVETVEKKDTADASVLSGALDGLLLQNGEQIEIKYSIKKVLQAPVQKGDFIGTITYIVDGVTWKIENVVLTESIQPIDFNWCLRQIVQNVFL